MLLLFVTIRSFRGHYSPEEHRGVEVPRHLLATSSTFMWIIVYSSVYLL